ncbi:oxidoreductase [Crassaminicella profunda]|uniref:oxidoreductase n=1 Tax=Crassaminicella profunda TaxID=1286698 RepID=UPI001CA7A663|nr:oxidoreductase [Crassaminicella profunda]QZY54301.1 SDR family oxidoreductase [Crassaminicella profunda]
MKNMFDLSGKVAVVTGGAGLIGKELVKALASYGAKVYIAEINEEIGKKVEKELIKKDLNVVFQKLDITSEESVNDFIKSIINVDKEIDIWVNNAYPRTSDWGLKIEKIPLDSWKQNIDMHLNGYFNCCQKIAEQMKKQENGSIINFGSIYGIVGPDFTIYEETNMTMPAAYAAIKGGIINFTRYLASYYGAWNVRVNCISPGGIFDNQPKKFVEKYSKKTPLKRMGNKAEMNGAIVYLASDASKFVTGHNLAVDGGWSII